MLWTSLICALLSLQWLARWISIRGGCVTLCLLFGGTGPASAHPQSASRSIFSPIEGQLSLSTPLRIGQPGTLIFSCYTSLEQSIQAEIEFRLPHGVEAESETVFNRVYLSPDGQTQCQVAIRVTEAGHYPLQASVYFITSSGLQGAEHFYLYLDSQPGRTRILPQPFSNQSFDQPMTVQGQIQRVIQADEAISMSGTLSYFNDNQRQVLPIPRATITLLQGDWAISSTMSDLDGQFQFDGISLNPQWTRTLQLSVEMKNDIVIVASPQQEVYTFKSDVIQDVAAGHIRCDLYLDDGNPNRGVSHIFAATQKARDFLLTEVNAQRSQPIDIIWPQDSVRSYYYTSQFLGRVTGEIIYIAAGADQWRKNVMYHEYGHAVMTAMYDYNFYAIPHGMDREEHRVETVSDAEFALSEGWAEFMEAAVDNRALNLTGLLDGYSPNVEENEWWTGAHDGSGSNRDGSVVEGSVASILWDIFDTANSIDLSPGSDDDQIDNRFDLLWAIFTEQQPKTIIQVAEAWQAADYPQWEALKRIYGTHHTIFQPNRPPVFEFILPGVENVLAGSSYQIEWTARDPDGDDFQIDLYYQRQYSRQPTLLQKGVSSQSFQWSTVNIADGRYFLLAKITDHLGLTSQVYSEALIIIDQIPLQPPLVTSQTHPQAETGVANNSPIFQFSILPVGQAVKGKNVYSYLLDHHPDTRPNMRANLEVMDHQLKLYGLPAGNWWLHVRVYDPLGYWSPTNHYPFIILPSDELMTTDAVVVDYLIELGLSEQNQQKIKKWPSEIRLQAHGFPTARDLGVLKDTIANLNGLMTTVRIVTNTTQPNLNVYFYPWLVLRLLEPSYSRSNLGYVSIQWQDHDITEGIVMVDNFRTDQSQRNYLIRKQITQALGLLVDSDSYTDSIFYQDWNQAAQLAPIDRQVISLLYSNDVDAGMTADQLKALNAGGLSAKPNQAEGPQLASDVNNDGTVNIFDLVIAAGSFGKTGTGIMGDVNGDDAVNIFDLVIVAGNFGKSLVAAPAMTAKIELTTEQKRHIASAIDKLESKANRSSAEEIALNVLKSILPERLPTQTQLLANYPNPFNPETWIPFQLAQDSTVTAKIYDVTGKQIRMIELGHIPAGSYVEVNRAIYWDGRSENGEQVSSGSYFYQLQVDEYTETKKMVILK